MAKISIADHLPRHRKQPILVKRGTESIDADTVGILTAKNDLSLFHFTHANRELFLAQFVRVEGRGVPERMELTWSPNDVSGNRRLHNQESIRTPLGQQALDFQGRSMHRSPINSVIIEAAATESDFFARAVDDVEIDCDAVVSLPSLLVLLSILCLIVCPF
jgi:hypothetical protein